jgi:hypothetical protein
MTDGEEPSHAVREGLLNWAADLEKRERRAIVGGSAANLNAIAEEWDELAAEWNRLRTSSVSGFERRQAATHVEHSHMRAEAARRRADGRER